MIFVHHTGVEKTNIVLLESYTVYSHSKENAASRFYIMKCSKLIKETNRVPIKDLIERFVSIVLIFLLAVAHVSRVNGMAVT